MTKQPITLPESLSGGYEEHFEGERCAVFDPANLRVCEPLKPFVTTEGIHGSILVEQVTGGAKIPFAILALMQGYSAGDGSFDAERKVVDVKRAQNHNFDPRNMIYPATAIIGIATGVIVRHRVVHLDDRWEAATSDFNAKLAEEQRLMGSELLKTLGLND